MIALGLVNRYRYLGAVLGGHKRDRTAHLNRMAWTIFV